MIRFVQNPKNDKKISYVIRSQWEQILTGREPGGGGGSSMVNIPFLAILYPCFQYVKITVMFTNDSLGRVCYIATNKLNLCTKTILPL